MKQRRILFPEPVRRLQAFRRSREGASAVEFALLSPVFFLIFGVMMDIGGVLFVNFTLNNVLSSAANYAVVNAASVAGNQSGLAQNLASIVADSRSAGWADAVAAVNNGITVTETGGAQSTSGSANTTSCYCPTVSGSTVTWGAATACGSTCASGGLAGKFVAITAQRAYQPIFSSYGIVKQGTLSAMVVVQAQ